MKARSNERKRIAREIHDSVNCTRTARAVHMKLLKELEQSANVRIQLGMLEEMALKSAKTVRREVSKLRDDYSTLELVDWQLRNLFCMRDLEVRRQAEEALVRVLHDVDALARIKRHVIFGPLLRFWRKFVNPSFPV